MLACTTSIWRRRSRRSSAGRALEEAEEHRTDLEALGAREVVAVDAAAYFSRPGPRLVDGLEMLAHLLHPDLVPEPATAERPLPL